MSPVGRCSITPLPSWPGLKSTISLNGHPENPFLGTSVTKVTAVDADDPTVSGHATVTYEVTTGGEYFTIDDSGKLDTQMSLHFVLTLPFEENTVLSLFRSGKQE